MNTTRLFAIATLFFLGGNAAVAATGPAWTEEGFIMEEVVVTASREDLRDRMLARLRLLRPALLDRG